MILLATAGALGTVAVPAASAHRRHRRPPSRCRGANVKISAASRAELKSAMVCLINVQRRVRGLPALRESARLDRSAQGWTNVMVHVHHFTHGADFASRISAVGFRWSNAGENIATGFRTPASVARAWMTSPGHCRNILSPAFMDVGTGVSLSATDGARGAGTWTQDFGLPMGTRRPTDNTGPAAGCPY